MSDIQVTTLKGLNLYVNPITRDEGEPIKAVNVISYPYGAKTKRTGYDAFLGTADGSTPQSSFQWIKDDGTTNYIYRASGTKLYYYNVAAGTGDWVVCGNGTIGAAAHVSHAVLSNTLIIADGVGSTRHTTNGTSFTDTTLAPVATQLRQYQNRIYALGTSSTVFYSTTNDASNWNLSGTSDSSSFVVPGGGTLSSMYKLNDRINFVKSTGAVHKWDGDSLVDTGTNLGPSSPFSIGQVEDYYFALTRNGIYGYGGGRPELISNPVQSQIYNNAGSGIAGGTFSIAPGHTHRLDYYLSAGTLTDDFTNETIPDAVIKYDYQKNEFLNFRYAHFPNTYLSYKDASGNQQLLIAGAGGQYYKMSPSTYNDAGEAIATDMIYLVDGKVPHVRKKWNKLWAFFNPGNQAKIQVAFADTYVKQSLKWIDIGDCSSGVFEERFKQPAVSKFLFIRIYESSLTAPFTFYGFIVDADPQPI